MRPVRILGLLVIAISMARPATAGLLDGLFSKNSKPSGCCDTCVPQPCYECCPEFKTETVTKHCWEIECERICVPRVRCPFKKLFSFGGCKSCGGCGGCTEGCCEQVCCCADVRVVRRLVKKEYECEECVVEWHVACKPPCCTDCAIPCAPVGPYVPSYAPQTPGSAPIPEGGYEPAPTPVPAPGVPGADPGAPPPAPPIDSANARPLRTTSRPVRYYAAPIGNSR